MNRTFKTDYQALSTFDDEANDDELDVPPNHNVVEIRPDQSRGQLAFIISDLGDKLFEYHDKQHEYCTVCCQTSIVWIIV